MGAVPKSKISRHRRGNRRRNQALTAPTLVICQHCGKWMRSHHTCKTCGMYRDRQIIAIAEPGTDE
jgi:large subunit ribosomal protein L32